MTPGDEPRRIESVDRACEIIGVLRSTGGATVSEVESQVDLSLGTVHTHLATLKANDFVMQVGTEYRLSPRLVTLGEHVRNHSDLYNAGRAKADELAEETGEAINLMTEYNGLRVILYQAFGQNAAGTEYHVRNREEPDRYLHYSATGKSMLAGFSEEKIDRIVEEHGLDARTEKTITDVDELHAELEEIRERGFALNDEEQVKGLRAVGAAITDQSGEVVGSISLSAPKHRLPEDRFTGEIADLVTNAADLIELNLRTRSRDL